MNDITGIILAGGKSRRFGTDKAFALFRGRKMIEYSIAALQNLCNTLVISAGNENYMQFGFPVVADNFPEGGPLSGMEACMKAFPAKAYLVSGCDTPLADSALFKTLLQALGYYDAVVLTDTSGKPEPLLGCYSASSYPVILDALKNKQHKVQDVLSQLNCLYLKATDPTALANINTIQLFDSLQL
ncbi:MAG: molybdopterin-guanine dinucleotide biosynthesis protein A [Bacteroidetes bacterium]|nr:MAG: molybdopterin-guanine dinucleotide biosynthesis protein A [Bacteroidota bacterium]